MPGHFELRETFRATDDRDYRQNIFGFGGGDHRDSADDGAATAAAITADVFHQDGGQQRGYKERDFELLNAVRFGWCIHSILFMRAKLILLIFSVCVTHILCIYCSLLPRIAANVGLGPHKS